MTDRKTFIQQSALALAGTCLPFSKLLAKEFRSVTRRLAGDTYHPSDCNIDLANFNQYLYIEDPLTGMPTSDSSVTVASGFYSKPYDDPNDNLPPNAVNQYNNDVQYQAEENLNVCLSPVPPNKCDNTDIYGENPFRYNVYYPRETLHDYAATPLPVYILFHAGGFKECTSYEGGDLKNLCVALAQKGFICFTWNTEEEGYWILQRNQ